MIAAAAIGAPVDRTLDPSLGGDDFAFMLSERPGAYVWIGNGPASEEQKLHNPKYDFNDAIPPVAANCLATVAKTALQANR